MRNRSFILSLIVGLGLATVLGTGCVVPQPRGEGTYQRVKEPRTGGVYHLYLPADYVRNEGRHPNHPEVKRWPLVMTFHGMKPYDNALPQEREWEQQADIYGFVVCAPELRTSDSLMEYPLTKEHGYVLKDRERVMAIMDHVFLTTRADPKRVLATSWSCGGYLAHYFPNRFPNRFSCIATRLSNFSSKLMIEETVPRYRDKLSVGVFIGDGDFPACKGESEEAVAWYTARNFRVVRGKVIDRMGHRRIPQVAAAFFAEQIGITPLRPHDAAKTLAEVQMTEYAPTPALIAKMSPPSGSQTVLANADRTRAGAKPLPPRRAPSPTSTSTRRPTPQYVSTTAGKGYPFDRKPSYDPYPGGFTADGGRKGKISVPPTGAGVTRVASARRANWLEPVKTPEPTANPAAAETSRRRASSGSKPPPTPEASRSNRDRGTRAGDRRTLASAGGVQLPRRMRTGRSTVPGKPAAAKIDAGRNARTPPRPFAPHDAGPRNLAPWSSRVSKENRSRDSQRTPRSSRSDVDLTGRPSPRHSFARGTSPVQSAEMPRSSHLPAAKRSRAERVNIQLHGPAVGTSPHYISYTVDLMPELMEGADFLWKVNGVWMGDEPSGVKILESPGLHRITVLMVTKNNQDYRGMETVQVLERGASMSSARHGTH